MKKLTIFCLGILSALISFGQVAPDKYFISFTDKENSPYSIDRPEEFLSARAIERRTKQEIPINQEDIPVNENYVTLVKNIGVTVLNRSKWLNGITVYCPDPSLIQAIRELPFVKNTIKSITINNSKPVNKFESEEVLLEVNSVNSPWYTSEAGMGYNYGYSFRQVHQLSGDSMHRMGYRGEGMMIAVLDAGFLHADILPAFDSLWFHNQILGTRDFVNPGNDVFQENEHGMQVLSIMGGNLPGQLIGTAPKATYWLLRTEEKNAENIIEEYNWVTGAEFADSVGADIINSSLGYTTFDDTTMNHSCADMTGDQTIVTKGANKAASRGMIVVNSAGNSGGTSWTCLSAPADGYYVVAVASVDSNGNRSPFSSLGESTRRIKPNVAAMGSLTVQSSPSGTIVRRSGTSFSSPLIAGMTACLWQAAPTWSNALIMRAIELSSNQINDPDSLVGYGIPDFPKALLRLQVTENNPEKGSTAYPNPFTDQLRVYLPSLEKSGDITLTLFDQLGRIWNQHKVSRQAIGEEALLLNNLGDLPAGSYFLRVTSQSNTQIIRTIKSGR